MLLFTFAVLTALLCRVQQPAQEEEDPEDGGDKVEGRSDDAVKEQAQSKEVGGSGGRFAREITLPDEVKTIRGREYHPVNKLLSEVDQVKEKNRERRWGKLDEEEGVGVNLDEAEGGENPVGKRDRSWKSSKESAGANSNKGGWRESRVLSEPPEPSNISRVVLMAYPR